MTHDDYHSLAKQISIDLEQQHAKSTISHSDAWQTQKPSADSTTFAGAKIDDSGFGAALSVKMPAFLEN